MIFRACPFEKEVEQALREGHWPRGCAPELRAHVESCRDCSDLVLVTQSFHAVRDQSAAEPVTESSGLLWWRAQLRRRYSATETVTRPVAIAQTFALFINLVVAIVFVAWQYRHGVRWAAWWSDVVPGRVLHLLPVSGVTFEWNPLLLILTLAALAAFSGLLVYLASERS